MHVAVKHLLARVENLMNICSFSDCENWSFEKPLMNKTSKSLFLALAFCATLIWRTATEECRTLESARCGNRCLGSAYTCACGNQSWTRLQDYTNTGEHVDKGGCCPSSLDSCIKDNNGKRKPVFFFLQNKTKKAFSLRPRYIFKQD